MRVFKRPGPVNTEDIIRIAEEASDPYNTIVAASVTGDSAVRLAERMPGKKVVCVTCPQGMGWEVERMQNGPFSDIPELRQMREEWLAQGFKRIPMAISQENRKRLESLGVPVIQGTIPFFGPSFSMRIHLRQMTSLDIAAKTLELISTGTLVCLECVLMAVDAGIVAEGELVLAVAGTERGLDTAWVIQASASANLFHPAKGCRFVELLAKPACSILPDTDIAYLR